MAQYIHPTRVTAISDSFQDHLKPSPDRGGKPSVNPGVDYKALIGDPLWAVADATIKVCSGGIAGTGGRYIEYRDIYGNVHQDLHLRNILVTENQTVKQGQQIGNTGASANGSENGVGQHVHHTMKLGGTKNVDFELYVDKSDTAGGDVTHLPKLKKGEVGMILYGMQSGRSKGFYYDPASGRRRYVNSTEISIIRTSVQQGGSPVPEFDVAQATLDAIPKVVGMPDHDGRIVGADGK